MGALRPSTVIVGGLIIVSGLATMIVMTRAGIDLLWTPAEDAPPRLSLVEVAPIGLLLAVCLALMLWAGPVMAYLEAASAGLHDPAGYLAAVAGAATAGGEIGRAHVRNTVPNAHLDCRRHL